MEKQYGYLSRYKADSTNEAVEEDGFSAFLAKEIGVGKKREFLQNTDDVFANGAENRSYIFYARTWSSGISIRDAGKRVPVFGFKENPQNVNRTLNHYCYFICSQEAITGPEFFSHVFGSCYIPAKEGTELEKPQERLAVEPRLIVPTWSGEYDRAARLVAEKLWEVQEQSPENRLLVLMDHADMESMKLLLQVYALLPAQLRVQTGFATNISYGIEKEDDLQTLFEAERLPIYLMTMERKHYTGLAPKCEVPVQIFDLTEALEQKQAETEKSAALRMLSGIVGEKTDLCLGFAEQQVMQQTGEVTSFQLYRQVLDALCSEELYWWKKKDLDTLWQVKELFEQQKQLMDYEPLYREALYYFYTEQMDATPYADEVNQMLRHTTERDPEMFAFLRNSLHYGSEMDATSRLIEDMEAEKQQEMKQLQQEREQEVKQLQQEQEQEVRRLQQEREQEVKQLQQEQEQLKQEQQQEVERLRQEQEQRQKEQEQLHRQEKDALKSQMQTALQEQYVKLEEAQQRTEALTEVRDAQDKRILGLETEIQNFRANLNEKTTALQQAQAEQKATREQLDAMTNRASSLDTELQKSRMTETEQRTRIEKLQAAVDEMNRSISEKGVRDLKYRLSKSESERKALEEEKETAKKQLTSLKAEHQDLEDSFERAKKQKLIFTILTAVFGVTTIAGVAAAAWMGLQGGTKKPEQETQQVTEAVQTETKEEQTEKKKETEAETKAAPGTEQETQVQSEKAGQAADGTVKPKENMQSEKAGQAVDGTARLQESTQVEEAGGAATQESQK